MSYLSAFLRTLAFGGSLALCAQHAPAADFRFPVETAPDIVSQPVELGSGWYLRGDVGWTHANGPRLSSISLDQKANLWNLDVGAGYKFNNWLRADATLGFSKPRDVAGRGSVVTCPYYLSGLSTQSEPPVNLGYLWDPELQTCNSNFRAELKKTDLMLNAYVDLGSWGGLTPFVGVGAGVSMLKSSSGLIYSKTSTGEPYVVDLTASGGFPEFWINKNGGKVTSWTDATGVVRQGQPPVAFDKQNWNRQTSKTNLNLAWSLMGGVAYDVTPQLKAELGYRYMNSGSFTSGASLLTSSVKSTITSHQVKLGLRYQID
jgi:opacity protein-like surface antigen